MAGPGDASVVALRHGGPQEHRFEVRVTAMEGREARRKAMAADPAFGVYLKAMAAADVLIKMENKIIAPTAFSPVQ